ncbi:hypothetical protein HWB57_gp080 [Erwinia phage vB_EamM-Bue1]|uniref:DUF7270 domain-containing protein n=2 Tax=Nezavisimistyvirus TaxID=2841279 RepID=A0A0A0YXF4_9CAUD|nr:hypothetical protein NW77_070 [Erwinia phage phiEa2809]YP_009837679.1 hypothetical protein HWB57_gp080 [Erwinia phage vB_EamM-Bue1]AIX13078.1 hypothetical protein NW77_070 [Erwinia phage phiEa2809]AVO22920.1 hypothetical protein [Erwinia phage vB_EamM-Bue1]
MRVVATPKGLKNLFILASLQGVKTGTIKAYYSGTIRRHETALTKSELLTYIEAFFAMSVVGYPDFATVIDPMESVDNATNCFEDMAANGQIRLMPQNGLYVIEGLYQNNFYLATESNVAATGVILWGVDGFGATCDSYLHKPIPFDGIDYKSWVAQFPNHGVAGNDVVLSLAAADAIKPLIDGWSPKLADMVADFRSFLPSKNF